MEQGSAERTWQFPEDASGLIPMVQAFRDSIQVGQEPETSGAEGLRDLEVVLKAYESMEQGVSLCCQCSLWEPAARYHNLSRAWCGTTRNGGQVRLQKLELTRTGNV